MRKIALILALFLITTLLIIQFYLPAKEYTPNQKYKNNDKVVIQGKVTQVIEKSKSSYQLIIDDKIKLEFTGKLESSKINSRSIKALCNVEIYKNATSLTIYQIKVTSSFEPA